MRYISLHHLMFLLVLLASCQQKPKTETTPWGQTIHNTSEGEAEDSLSSNAEQGAYSLSDIQQAGEMIMLTLYGPDTYYEYRGRGMGINYLLCEKLAEKLGVTLRVDICKDTTELTDRLKNGEGDIIAVNLNKKHLQDFTACGIGNGTWLVAKNNTTLASAIDAWFSDTILTETQKLQKLMLSSGSVKRHVYPAMLSAKQGRISQYDQLFKKHAPTAGMDWILMAAQCYQESCFDPRAHSWAGACGLMQIMPQTADHIALPRARLYEPEANIAASARYMKELLGLFSDINNPQEQLNFALAAYNGGHNHVRDAMALAKKHGRVWQRWSDVKQYILALQNPRFYKDPVVKHGYMRGSETAGYVDAIMQRYAQYRHALRTGKPIVSNVKVSNHNIMPPTPHNPDEIIHHRAAKKNKWRKE